MQLQTKEFLPNTELEGTITINFQGRYDGILINTQILDSNDLVTFTSYNDKKISQTTARLFVDKAAIPHNKIEFTFSLNFTPQKKQYEVKFRASIIEQHKEIDSTIIFGNLLSS